MAWTYTAHTMDGLALRQKQVDSDIVLKLTKAVAGTGTVNPAELWTQKALVNQKQVIELGNVIHPNSDAAVIVPVTLRNDNVTEGYNVEQIGVYAEDPDKGEILYFISQADKDGGDEVPSESKSPGFSIDWNFTMKVANVNKVEVTVNRVGILTINQADARYASKEEQKNLEDKVDHLDISGQLKDYARTEEVNNALKNYYTKEEIYTKQEVDVKIDAAGGGSVIVSDTAPSDNTSALWIDTSAGGVPKYWDGTAWVASKAVWG